MPLIAAFAVVLGVSAALAVLLYAAPIRSLVKAALFISMLGGLALLLYLPTYTLADIGAVELVVMVGVTWVLSFLLAPLPLGAWQLGSRPKGDTAFAVRLVPVRECPPTTLADSPAVEKLLAARPDLTDRL